MIDEGTTYDARWSASPLPGPRALVASLEGAHPAVVELPAGGEVSVGRSRSSAVRVDDRRASRLHVTLRWDGAAGIFLTDHGSRNGTYLDGARVRGTVEVPRGAEIRIGAARLLVTVTGSAGSVGAEGSAADAPAAVDDDLVLARDPAMLRALALADRAARTGVTVLLVGETGAGKEVLARRIHELSERRAGPFVPVNCGTIPETLAESALFGHERGSFTGASERQVGYFEAAHGGTLFLDEVGELSAPTQVRLLRVLEEHAVTRVGGTEPRAVDVRLLAATHRDLQEMTHTGGFREDLLYRLDVLRIDVPPLRERPDDILPLAERFLHELMADRPLRFDADAARALRSHGWPGNVRELRNVVERAITMAEGDRIGVSDLRLEGASARAGGALRGQVHATERDAIVEAMRSSGGNQTRAAQRLGIARRTLIYKLEKYGLKARPQSRLQGRGGK